jgi:hypothetical protein
MLIGKIVGFSTSDIVDRMSKAGDYIRAMSGMIIKFKQPVLKGATFLRGWWVPDSNLTRHHWMPLPSMIVKLGKVLTEPKLIAQRQENDEMAYAVCAHALSSSFGFVPEDYPILGPFLGCLRRFAAQAGVVSTEAQRLRAIESWSLKAHIGIEAHHVDPSRIETVGMIYRRYHIDKPDIEALETMFDRVNRLPAFVSHPAVIQLTGVDYDWP